jgi:hypothetical protein
MSRTRGELFLVTLRPCPAGPDTLGREPAYRLRRFLKTALRRFGLRAVSVQKAPSATPSSEPAATQTAENAALAPGGHRLQEPVGGDE